eukprot:COSAG05_NODE_1864_length_3937_cov_21.205315_1_plen_39_part_00
METAFLSLAKAQLQRKAALKQQQQDGCDAPSAYLSLSQ